jgi:hypothetical protein
MLDTSNSNNYEYITKHLELHILGGIKTNKLESLRITLSIQKLKQENNPIFFIVQIYLFS